MATVGTFQALDLTCDVEVEGDSTIDVGLILRDLRAERDDGPRSTYRFSFGRSAPNAGELFEDHRLVGSAQDRVLVDLMLDRLSKGIADDEELATFRATTLRLADTTIVLTGPPRRGKSTLAARLLLDTDASLVSEDVCVVDPSSLEIRCYHRPLGLSERAFDVLGVSIPPESGEPCGCGGKVLVAPDHLGAGLAGPGRPTVVASIDHADHGFRPSSPAAVLADMLRTRAMAVRTSAARLDTLVRMLAGARCFSIGSKDLGAAADWISQLATQAPPEPVPTLVEASHGRIDVFAGQEAVVVADDEFHHLNPSAAAVWLLRSEGQDAAQIAHELDMDRALVARALEEFETAGFG